jgi:hypothetical protein
MDRLCLPPLLQKPKMAKVQTETGLEIKAQIDTAHYPTGIKITDEELQALQLEKSEFHGEWNYTLKSHKD